MKLEMPKVVEEMVRASNEKNLVNYVACFTEDASVDDVGEVVRGKKAIGDSFAGKKYEYQIEPLEVTGGGDEVTMNGKVVGNFKGSPLNFSFRVKLEGGLIAELRIGLV